MHHHLPHPPRRQSAVEVLCDSISAGVMYLHSSPPTAVAPTESIRTKVCLPNSHSGYIWKRRKWPMKGWHKVGVEAPSCYGDRCLAAYLLSFPLLLLSLLPSPLLFCAACLQEIFKLDGGLLFFAKSNQQVGAWASSPRRMAEWTVGEDSSLGRGDLATPPAQLCTRGDLRQQTQQTCEPHHSGSWPLPGWHDNVEDNGESVGGGGERCS